MFKSIFILVVGLYLAVSVVLGSIRGCVDKVAALEDAAAFHDAKKADTR